MIYADLKYSRMHKTSIARSNRPRIRNLKGIKVDAHIFCILMLLFAFCNSIQAQKSQFRENISPDAASITFISFKTTSFEKSSLYLD